MTRCIFGACLICLLAHNRAEAQEPKKPLADFNITEIASTKIHNNRFRAVKGYDEIYPWLVIEVIKPAEMEGDADTLLHSWNLWEMSGGEQFGRDREGDNIGQVAWRGEELGFVFTRDRRKSSCVVSHLTGEKPTVSCRKNP